MAKIAASKLPIYMTLGDAVPLPMVPTAITNAKPAVATVASTAGATLGDLALPSGTGVALLDGALFVAGNVVAGALDLIGSDLSSLAAPPAMAGADEVIDVYPRASTMVRLCLSNIEIAAASQATINVGTYCEDGALPGPVTLGDVTLTGYVDITDPCYTELLQASEDSAERLLVIELPNNGYIVGRIGIGAISWSFARDGAVGFTIPATQAVAFRHVY